MITRTTIPITAPNTSAVIAGLFEVIRSRSTEKKYILFYATIKSYQFSYIEHLIIVHNLHLNRSELQMSVSHFLYR